MTSRTFGPVEMLLSTHSEESMRLLRDTVESTLLARGWVVADLRATGDQPLEWFWPPTSPVDYARHPEWIDPGLRAHPQMYTPTAHIPESSHQNQRHRRRLLGSMWGDHRPDSRRANPLHRRRCADQGSGGHRVVADDSRRSPTDSNRETVQPHDPVGTRWPPRLLRNHPAIR